MAKFNDKSFKVVSQGAAASGRGLEPLKQLTKRVTIADMDAAATSQAVSIGDTPTNMILMGVTTKVFALADDGASIASATLNVGTAGNPDLLVDDLDILTGSGSVGFARQSPEVVGDDTIAQYPFPSAGALSLQMLVTADVNVDTLTALDVEVTLHYFAPTDPDA